MRIGLILFLASRLAFAQAGVTSQEEFSRLRPGGSPELHYNFERAYLEVPSSYNCPSGSRAFFNVHISETGDVKRIRGRLLALSMDLKSAALKWADGLLKQMHFRPLMYGSQASSVDMALTLVCKAP